ncbi:MAG: LON peptidase substrate-binding domain-containing protein [Verrucomicrobia bacterium]|nr:LON peptidase substrate-binding domain-containing protein [Leptolyngbya sp. ES-bin-22]
MTNALNKTIGVGTDEAAWFLYHPDDLAHRAEDPSGWCYSDFAVSKEFAAGRLIGVGTGSDGSFRVRFTNQGLTEREHTYVACSKAFRLHIQHDRLYLDGGYQLPSAEVDDPDYDADGWLDLPNGAYRAIVSALAWYDEPGATDNDGTATEQALTSYVVEFQSVANLEDVTPPTDFPWLDPSRPTIAYYPQPQEISQPLIAGEYRLLERPEVLFPGISLSLPLAELEYRQLEEMLEDINTMWEVVISSALEAQSIGTFFKFSSMSSSGYPTESFKIGGIGLQLVQLRQTFDRNGFLWANVESYEPPFFAADSNAIAQLQQRFADYAAQDTGYQQRIPHYSFYAERIAALTNPRQLGWFVANALDLTVDRQQALLALSDRDLIQQLIQLLEP